MTKREFQKQFGDKAAELMSNPTFHIALDVAREDCKYIPSRAGIDATSIIRHDGLVEGWMECLNFLKSLHKSEPETPPAVHTPLYADPDRRKSDKNQ